MGCVNSKSEVESQTQESSKSMKKQEVQMSSNFTTILYGGGPFYSSTKEDFDRIKQSGFTTIMCWGLHIDSNANIVFNNPPIIEGGNGQFTYVGDINWPNLLASLKEGDTQVNRVMFSIGGSGVQDFQNIKNLIYPNGTDEPPNTGPDSTLYKAFDALKTAIPCIDGFDLDDESLYDQPTTVAFSRMLARMGYQVTFCPYERQTFWNDCLKELNTDHPGLVTGYNLQCYSGGTGNQPGDWIQSVQDTMKHVPSFNAAGFVFPGLSCRTSEGGQCPSGISETFKEWQSTGMISGGFIWLYDHILTNERSGICGPGIPMDATAYTQAIVSGLS